MCHSTKPADVLTNVFYRHPQKQIVREVPVRNVFMDTHYRIDSTRILLV